MLIILEGRDKTGKTTLFKHLQNRYRNYKNIKFFTPTYYCEFLEKDINWCENSFLYDNVLLFDFLAQTTNYGKKHPHIIMDRSFITEIIYGKVLNRVFTDTIPFNEMIDWYISELQKYKHLIIYCIPYTNKNIPDDKWDNKTLKKISYGYKLFYNKYKRRLNIKKVNLFEDFDKICDYLYGVLK